MYNNQQQPKDWNTNDAHRVSEKSEMQFPNITFPP